MTRDARGGTAAESEGQQQAAPELTLREGLPEVVADEVALRETVERFRAGHGPVAVDAERASGHRYSQRAYLVQLRRAGAGTAMIDPTPFGAVPNESLTALADAVGDAEWVIHAASQDLACLAELGLRPRHLFDTELGGRLLNLPRVGLATLMEEFFGVRMRKEHSAVDWSRRPLRESWLRYAALDVEMLLELRSRLRQELVDAGKLEWARQEFAALTTLTPPPRRTDPWRRTSGIHRVRNPRALAVLRAVWYCRDSIARERDITPSHVVRDPALVEAALAQPGSLRALARLPGFASGGGRRFSSEFAAAVAEALALDPDQLPPRTPPYDGPPPARVWGRKFPEAADRLGRCREAVSAIAETLQLPQENLLAPDAVRRLAWQPPEPLTEDRVAAALTGAGARPWQVHHTAAALTAVLGEP